MSSVPPPTPPIPPPPSGPPAPAAPPAYPPGYPPYAYYHRPTDGMAITSLVLGIVAAVGVFLCYGIPSVIAGPVAIYLGFRAQHRIRDSGGALGGHGVAMAGWITGVIATCVGAVILIIFVLFVGLIGFSAFYAATHATPTP